MGAGHAASRGKEVGVGRVWERCRVQDVAGRGLSLGRRCGTRVPSWRVSADLFLVVVWVAVGFRVCGLASVSSRGLVCVVGASCCGER